MEGGKLSLFMLVYIFMIIIFKQNKTHMCVFVCAHVCVCMCVCVCVFLL